MPQFICVSGCLIAANTQSTNHIIIGSTMKPIELNAYYTLIAATIVLLLGRVISTSPTP